MANYPARNSGDQTINYLRAPLTFAVGNAGTVQVGTLPAGCVVLRSYIIVTTAFNAGTLNQGTIGTIAAPTALSTTITIGVVGIIAGTPLAGATAASVAPTVDTAIIFTSTSTGTVSTAGVGVIVVEFCPVA